jgi:uncharacterized membrane protein (UPF0127 family)
MTVPKPSPMPPDLMPDPAHGPAHDLARAPAHDGRGRRTLDAVARRFAARLVATLLAATVAAPLGAQPAPARPEPQPTLPKIEIQAGLHVIRAEVADAVDTRMRGLMMREKLGTNEGMLFVFEQKAGHCFWMRNTLLPLSIAFVDDDGTIANIEDMKPQTEDSHCPVRPIRYALEMEQGWFAKRGLKAGAKLTQPKLFKAASKP